MARSCSSSSDTSSPKYEFSDSDSDHKRRGNKSRPRRLPTSNSKNAVAARINRMKQKQYVKDLEQKMSQLKREIKGVKRELREREEKWASSRRQVAYLRSMLANSNQIGGLLRNIRWRNIVPQEERDSDHPHMVPPPVAPQEDEGWALLDGINPSTTEVGVCLHVSNRRISVEFCDECSNRFYDNPYGSQT
ncbi:PREDICTED: CREB/ATF bZIP transcription factor-like isoform X3 [Diuraphis noxia]|uniref:CREB/ATF bZIP transcription factor-like isoform X3 n=1 Tax=Diuraphis noxia TaxID=143948 RepID=UPI000763AED4|nr:PREDICTED: CREB/ATF bZIP transcription factor-like isoform X3 [Diuraphis noxia]